MLQGRPCRWAIHSKLEARERELEAQLHSAKFAFERLQDFVPMDGTNLQCPRGWIEHETLSALRPTSHGSGNRSIFECDTGKYEFTLRSPADHYHAALAFLPIKHVLAVLLEGVETLLQRPQHRYALFETRRQHHRIGGQCGSWAPRSADQFQLAPRGLPWLPQHSPPRLGDGRTVKALAADFAPSIRRGR
jgi:hypothetical protein